ncbi:hypothetical protein OSH08_05670 [Kaistia geumhonensis]|uniref:Uncharacterized protein n=1 Tax=Kaistia geumhonensis TaxID=410839 RepID=A0ABU0M648_9HYPH|nr:hypothetical protein [Kaistia geumhonensis]MCX5478482.1 hypothetical protein [Kaistia geumhonensis]MDQ0516300.1 hypothetical protein [Kaistia geumhonensis]
MAGTILTACAIIFVAVLGTGAGLVIGLLLLAATWPLWLPVFLTYPGSDELAVTVAMLCGGLGGASISVALYAQHALRPASGEDQKHVQ